MKKFLRLVMLLAFLVPSIATASDYLYRRPNNQADYVKLDKVKENKTTGAPYNHPYKFTEEQMIDMLRSLRYSRKNLFGNGEKYRFVYELEYINQFAPILVEAFAKAAQDQRIFWSIAQKRPLFILRNDRLTQVQMWVSGNELHINFIKTEAQLEGDYQAKTTGEKLIDKAKGLRIELEPQEGQKFSFSSSQELILDINQDWDRIATNVEIEDKKLQDEVKARKSKYNAPSAATSTATTPIPANPPLSAKDQKSAEDRLSELKKLQDKGLISKEDYEKKKKEILQGM
jgi:putative oligomerization/nucleic acid binding protein